MFVQAKEDAKLAAAAPSGGGGGRKSKQTAPVPAAEKPLHVQVCIWGEYSIIHFGVL